MKDFVKRMIEEHAQLITRTQALHNYVYSDKSNEDNKFEFANKCIQLSAMKKYEEALRARLINQGIEITDDGEYYEKVANIVSVTVSNNEPENNVDPNEGGKSE